MLEIWGRKTSSNVQALMWCIGELGLADERHDVGHRFGGTETALFRSINPNGTVSVLRDGDSDPLWEPVPSSATWPPATERLRSGRLMAWPAPRSTSGPSGRSSTLRKLSTGPIFWRVVRTASADQDRAAIHHAIGTLGSILDIAEAQLARGTFLAGDDFTLADIQFGHVLFRYFDIPIIRQDRPSLRRYYDSLAGRPAFREHVTVSYEELRVPS